MKHIDKSTRFAPYTRVPRDASASSSTDSGTPASHSSPKLASSHPTISDVLRSPEQNLVRLDVGGLYYTTSTETLTREPTSFLAALIAPQSPFAPPIRTARGRIFIDRDGQNFSYVLNHLRGLSLPKGLAESSLSALREEAAFFGLEGLEREARVARKLLPFRREVTLAKGTKNYRFALTELGHKFHSVGEVEAATRKYFKAFSLAEASDVTAYCTSAAQTKDPLLKALRLLAAARHTVGPRRLELLAAARKSSDAISDIDIERACVSETGSFLEHLNIQNVSIFRPQSLAYCMDAARLLSKEKRNESALVACDEALRFEPTHFAALFLKGSLLTRMNRPAEATIVYDAAENAQPQTYEDYAAQSTLFLMLGRPHDALEAAEESLRIRPNFVALQNSGRMLSTLGRHAEALSAYQRAIELEPANPAIQQEIDRETLILQRLTRELHTYDLSLSLPLDPSPLQRMRGIALEGLGRYQEALSAFAEADFLDQDESISNLTSTAESPTT